MPGTRCASPSRLVRTHKTNRHLCSPRPGPSPQPVGFPEKKGQCIVLGGLLTWLPRLFLILVGFDRTVSPNAFAQSARWPTAPGRSGLPRGHYFRAPNRCPLADAAEKTGVRLRYDLLATIAGLAAEWNLGFDPLRIAGLPLA